MSTDINKIASTIIISVYDDHVALQLILRNLQQQTMDTFEVIVSEDGESEHIKNCVSKFKNSNLQILHLTQKDIGFRKNIALNRAVKASKSDHLIFIDGDCIPHPAFIESHQSCVCSGITCTGRRLELGKRFSTKLRNGIISISRLTNGFLYLMNSYTLFTDNAKNIESGIYSKTLHTLTKNREIRLLGCNFSCNKQDLIKINGFNEAYQAPGIGEDSDIDWRLIKAGVKIKNVKFSAIQYHLYHPRSYLVSKKNSELFEETKRSNTYRCNHGINKDRD